MVDDSGDWFVGEGVGTVLTAEDDDVDVTSAGTIGPVPKATFFAAGKGETAGLTCLLDMRPSYD